jgi:hypothetical protein
VGRTGPYARAVGATELSNFAAALREAGAARFTHGFAWGSPELRPEGQRGVGFIDFSTGRTHVVQIAMPPGAARRLESPTSQNPARRWFARVLGRATATRNAPVEVLFEHGRAAARHSRSEQWKESEIPNPAWLVDLLDLPPGVARLVDDRQTGQGERQVEVALDRRAVSEAAPRLVQATVRQARSEGAIGGLALQLTFSPVGRPRELSLSLGRTTYTGERYWITIEFDQLGPSVAPEDLWEAAERLAVVGSG